MTIGSRLNVWITDCGPVKYRAEVSAIRADARYGLIPSAVRVVAPDGRIAEEPLRLGQFVVINDQEKPEWEP